MLTDKEQEKANEYRRQHPQECAEYEAYMDKLVGNILKQMREDREKFMREIGLA